MTKTRATLRIGSTDYALTLKKETVTIQAGLIHKNLPAQNSQSAWQLAVWGRGREIILEGRFIGTQTDIEEFIDDIESWMNEGNSFQSTAKYYPMFHKDNDPVYSGSNLQGSYYNVMCDQFIYAYDVLASTQIDYTIVLREGTKLGIFNVDSGEVS